MEKWLFPSVYPCIVDWDEFSVQLSYLAIKRTHPGCERRSNLFTFIRWDQGSDHIILKDRIVEVLNWVVIKCPTYVFPQYSRWIQVLCKSIYSIWNWILDMIFWDVVTLLHVTDRFFQHYLLARIFFPHLMLFSLLHKWTFHIPKEILWFNSIPSIWSSDLSAIPHCFDDYSFKGSLELRRETSLYSSLLDFLGRVGIMSYNFQQHFVHFSF